MINYSIVMRGVNANLFEINQAKARIKAAQAAGQTPSGGGDTPSGGGGSNPPADQNTISISSRTVPVRSSPSRQRATRRVPWPYRSDRNWAAPHRPSMSMPMIA